MLGLAPGVVGLGLYLTVERQYPLYWLVLCLFAVVLLLVIVGFGAYSTPAVTASGAESLARI